MKVETGTVGGGGQRREAARGTEGTLGRTVEEEEEYMYADFIMKPISLYANLQN